MKQHDYKLIDPFYKELINQYRNGLMKIPHSENRRLQDIMASIINVTWNLR